MSSNSKATAAYQDQPEADGLLQLFSFDIMNKNSSTSIYIPNRLTCNIDRLPW